MNFFKRLFGKKTKKEEENCGSLTENNYNELFFVEPIMEDYKSEIILEEKPKKKRKPAAKKSVKKTEVKQTAKKSAKKETTKKKK